MQREPPEIVACAAIHTYVNKQYARRNKMRFFFADASVPFTCCYPFSLRWTALTERGVVHIPAVDSQHGSSMVKSSTILNGLRLKLCPCVCEARRLLCGKVSNCIQIQIFHCFGDYFGGSGVQPRNTGRDDSRDGRRDCWHALHMLRFAVFSHWKLVEDWPWNDPHNYVSTRPENTLNN